MIDKLNTKSKIFIRSFGCQMNDRDSELVIGQFLAHGYKLTEKKADADVIIYNTCSVRQHAEEKVFSELGTLKKMQGFKQKAPLVGVVGCMAKNLENGIIERIPQVDLVVGPNDLAKLYDYVREIQRKGKHIVEVSSQIRDKSFYKYLYHHGKKHSYVNISEGCSNFCSYCVVPYVRGGHRSRAVEDILEEIKQLVSKGISAITLLGQNVNDYQSHLGRNKIDFVSLLDMISDTQGVKELGFVTSHPKDVDIKLFDLMAKKKNIKQYLHLPIQSGSNRILKLMNRRYTREKYLKIIEQYRKKNPRGILATDIIVGFPTETEDDFKETLDLINRVKFDFAFIFKYSPRPHTKAADMVDDVTMDTKKKRHKILLDLQRGISKTKQLKKR